MYNYRTPPWNNFVLMCMLREMQRWWQTETIISFVWSNFIVVNAVTGSPSHVFSRIVNFIMNRKHSSAWNVVRCWWVVSGQGTHNSNCFLSVCSHYHTYNQHISDINAEGRPDNWSRMIQKDQHKHLLQWCCVYIVSSRHYRSLSVRVLHYGNHKI